MSVKQTQPQGEAIKVLLGKFVTVGIVFPMTHVCTSKAPCTVNASLHFSKLFLHLISLGAIVHAVLENPY